MLFAASRAARLRRLLAVAIVSAAAVLFAAVPAQASFGFLNGVNMHGEGSGGLLQFDQPRAIARDTNGNFYVADTGNHRILKLDSTGDFVTQWGIQGTGDGQFQSPNGVAISPLNGDVWVSDGANHRLQRFTQSGTFVSKVGSSGTGNGQFNYAGGVAVDTTGTVYASDTNNNRVQYFDSTGTYVGQFGGSGSGDGLFNRPNGITVDTDGTVYVVDRFNNRVQYFAPITHAFAGKWGYNSSSNGAFVAPQGIAINTLTTPHQVYVTNDYFDHRVQRFSLSGTYLGKWGPEATLSPGSALGDMSSPTAIVVSGTTAYVVDTGNYRIEKFTNVDTTPTAVEAWGTNGTSAGQINDPGAVAAAPDGGVYVVDTYNSRIERFAANGSYLGQWGAFGTGNGQFDHPYGIAVGTGGAVYVSDYDNDRIQKFSADGTYLSQWSAVGSYGNLYYPMGIDTDSAGNVYVADGSNQRIVKFDADGGYIWHWGQSGYGDANADFQFPSAVAVNPAGTVIYVSDEQTYRIKKFDAAGAFIASTHDYSGWGTGDGQMKYPGGLDIDPITGDVLVADRTNNRFQRFDSSLVFVSKYNATGRGDGEFQGPRGVSFDRKGNVWFADSANDRVQRFGDAPVVEITTPAGGSSLADATPLIEYTSTDPAASCDRVNGSDAGPFSNGPQSVTVTCTNARGSGSATVTFNVAAPTLVVPAPTLKLAKKIKAATKLKFSVACVAGCTISGSVQIGKRRLKLKSVSIAAENGAQKVAMTLSKKQLSAVRAAMAAHKKVSFTVTASDPTGGSTKASARLK